MKRDGISAEEADDLIFDAKEAVRCYFDNGDWMNAEEVVKDMFGLEPDYLDELLPV